jgi:hypothetical protein
MDYTLQLIFQVAVAVAMLVLVALNALAVFAVVTVPCMMHDHWSMKQLWEHARHAFR